MNTTNAPLVADSGLSTHGELNAIGIRKPPRAPTAPITPSAADACLVDAVTAAVRSEVPGSVELVGWSVTSSHGGNATGSVTLTVRGEDRSAEATGNGPVDALYSAVDSALQPVLGWHPVLVDWEIKAVSGGEDAQGQVLARCRRSSDEGPGALVVTGHGLSTNIIEASIEGYLGAVNKLHGAEINGVVVAFVGRRTAEELP